MSSSRIKSKTVDHERNEVIAAIAQAPTLKPEGPYGAPRPAPTRAAKAKTSGNTAVLVSTRPSTNVSSGTHKSVHQTSTRERKMKGDLTSSSQIKAMPAQGEARRKKQEDEDQKSPILFFLIAALAVLLVGGFATLLSTSSLKSATKRHSGLSRTELENRVQYHLRETGMKLNSDRITVEYDNAKSAPPLDRDARRLPPPSTLSGVVLQGEKNTRDLTGERVEPVDPDYPDARVQYGLQDEQAAQEWEKKAQWQFLHDFTKNAEASGLDIRINKNYDVQVSRRPNSVDSSSGTGRGAPSGSGAAR